MFTYSKNLWEWKEKTKNSKILNQESSTKYCEHSFWRWKKKGRRRVWTNNTTIVCIQLWPLFTEEGLPHSQKDSNLEKTRETLVAKQKELKKAGKGNKTKAARALTDEEVDVLHSKELLGVSSPESLLNTLWLNNTQHFGLRGCQEHRSMRCGDVQLQTSADGTEFH